MLATASENKTESGSLVGSPNSSSASFGDRSLIERLDDLLDTHPVEHRSPYNNLKQLPKRPTRNHQGRFVRASNLAVYFR